MLIKFESKDSANFVMFSDVAAHLLELMGQRGLTEGSISGEELVQARSRLESGLAQRDREPANVPGMKPEGDETDGDEDEEAPRISLDARAAPLIEMLRRAEASDEGFVMWRPE
ncbi:MAG: DUF1840 family protein [Pseudohongiellaceae bacterium]